MDITIIRDIVTRHELNDMAKRQFGDMGRLSSMWDKV